MNNFADALESYLVPVEEAEGKPSLKSKALAITIALAAIATVAIPGVRRAQKQVKADKLRKENRQAWLNSPETQSAISYVNKTYGIDYATRDDFSAKKVYIKLHDSIKKDIIKISKKLIANKTFWESLSGKTTTNPDEWERKWMGASADNVSPRMCQTSPKDYSIANDYWISFEVFTPTGLRSIDDIFYDAYITALNEKYANEIHCELISKFSSSDAEDGFIECEILQNAEY